MVKLKDLLNEGQKIKSDAVGMDFFSLTKDFNNGCMKIAKEMASIKGDKVDGRIFLKQVQKSLVPLIKLMKSWDKGQQESPGLSEETLEESPDNDLYRSFKAINNDIVRIINKFGKKADVDKALHTWMVGLQASLKKMGYKL